MSRGIAWPPGFLPPFNRVGQPRDTFKGRGRTGVHMTHYVPLQLDNGLWGVCYQTHRRDFVAVMECPSLEAAYHEAAAMTLEATKRALCGTPHDENNANRYVGNFGNRYLRKYQ